MYSVLLVDDEKIIREGVYELLSMENLDLDLMMAASAVEALEILEERKIDILIMDIRMPQMTGLELYDVIREKWPHSKLIFLTGYLEFDYVYKVHKHARYVLKAEDDQKIIDAVKESIADIENDLLLEHAALERARHQQRSKYYERILFFRELVEGGVTVAELPLAFVDNLEIDLDLNMPAYALMISCSGMRQLSFEQQCRFGETLSLLIEKFFLEPFRGNYFIYNKKLTYLLLQPKKAIPNPTRVLEAYSETFQKSVRMNVNLDVSILINSAADLPIRHINDFSAMRDRMLSMAVDEVCVDDMGDKAFSAQSPIPEHTRKELSRKIQYLENHFENLDRDTMVLLIEDLKASVLGLNCMQDLFFINAYCSVTVRILGYAKKAGLRDETATELGFKNLYNISQFSCWSDAFQSLLDVMRAVFKHVDLSIENKNEDVIKKVKSYILDNLDGDTSLYALSNYVHLCPEHLLRTFKKQENITILQYINDLKLSKAKAMLSQSELQIKEIATSLGFTSAGYFGRFFKGKTGVTPNAYREQHLGMRKS